MAEIKRAKLRGIRDTGRQGVEYEVRFYDDEGNRVNIDGNDQPSEVTLEGYEVGEPEALEETDTVLEALGKLEARIAELENA